MTDTQGFLGEVEQFGEAVVSDLETWAKEAESFVAGDAKIAWNAVKPLLTSLPSEMWAQLQPIAQKVYGELVAELEAGASVDLGNFGDRLLNGALAAGINVLHTLESNVFTGVSAALFTAAKAAV